MQLYTILHNNKIILKEHNVVKHDPGAAHIWYCLYFALLSNQIHGVSILMYPVPVILYLITEICFNNRIDLLPTDAIAYRMMPFVFTTVRRGMST